MEKLVATVESVHAGSNDDMSKEEHANIEVDLEGVVSDGHRSFERKAFEGDKQPEGTIRRNERQWSAVSKEELQEISDELNLTETITATCVGANLCLSGVGELSRLPKGTIFRFPSGAELQVEEYNPPCKYMGEKVAELYSTTSGEPISFAAFSKAAKLKRGLVGVVEVAGTINAGDQVEITVYEHPSWLARVG